MVEVRRQVSLLKGQTEMLMMDDVDDDDDDEEEEEDDVETCMEQ